MSVKILIGDVRARLAELPDDHFDCVVTSPPYWGLRDYGVDGQIGLEPTLGEHLDVMVEVFREVRRVLKPSGTCWVNYGDCYATAPNGRSAAETKALGEDDRTFRDKPFSTVGPIYPAGGRRGGGNAPAGPVYEHDDSGRQARRGGRTNNLREGKQSPASAGRIVAGGELKPKDLCMVPNRLAIALQEDGWYVRSEIIWGKLNPMPESIFDRPATAHEKIFMLVKSGKTTGYRSRDTNEWNLAPDLSERMPWPTEDDPDATVNRWRACDYYYNARAVRIEASEHTHARHAVPWRRPVGWAEDTVHDPRAHNVPQGKQDATAAATPGSRSKRTMGFNERYKRSKTAPAGDAFIRANETQESVQSGDVLPDRNLRNYEPAPLEVWPIGSEPFKEAHFATFPTELARRAITAGCPEGGLILDPFGGAGTVALVAERLFCDAVLIELNQDYAEIARKRITREGGAFADVGVHHD